MTENELLKLLAYPEAQVRRARLIRQARELYNMGRDGERHQPVLQSIEGELRKFYLYPTFNCPLRCPYCYAEGGERSCAELPPEDLLRITQQAIEAGFRSVVLVGGEPLVYSGFPAYIDGLSRLDRKNTGFILRTSFAFRIPEERMRKLCAVFDEITVSIDGDEETNDANRGHGSFLHATENVLKALALGATISISSLLTAEQARGRAGEYIRSFCKEHGIKKLVINSAVPMGRASGTDTPYFEWRSDMRQAENILPKFSCGLGHSLYMEPDGRLFPCYAWCEKQHQLGDLSRETLRDILDRGELLSLMNTGTDTNEKCRSCDVRYFCGGRCKIWVRNKTDVNSGDFDCDDTRNAILKKLKYYGVI